MDSGPHKFPWRSGKGSEAEDGQSLWKSEEMATHCQIPGGPALLPLDINTCTNPTSFLEDGLVVVRAPWGGHGLKLLFTMPP